MSTSGKGSSIGLALFGLVFFLVGAGFLAFSVVPNLYDWMRMQAWVAIPAELEHLDLETHRSDDSTTYKVVARYRYDFDSRHYTNDRVGISSGSDNIGDWHRDTYSVMRRVPLSVWVNPENPEESVFDRELRWGLLGFKLIFVVVFGGVGTAILWFATRKRAPRPAGAPLWRGKAEWRDNHIRSNARTAQWVAWGFALLWNAISAPVAFVLPDELAKGNHAVLVAALFPLVGAGLLVFAIRATLQWRRFGPTLLSLDPFPGAIGGDVGGAVEVRIPYNPSHRFEATLTCTHVYTTRSGNKTRTNHDVLWQDTQQAATETGMRGMRVRFHFQVPDELPQSEERSRNYHEWSVQLRAELPGVDFDRRFDIPVFATGERRTSSAAVRREPAAEISAPPESTVRVRETGGGLELHYPLFRNAKVGVGVLIIGMLFAGFPAAFHFIDGLDGPPTIMLALFGLVGIALALAGLYSLGNSLSVSVSPRGLTTVRRVFGLPFTRHTALSEIVSLDKRIGVQTSSGTRQRAYYSVHARTREGRKLALGDSLPSASAADRIIALISHAAGLREGEATTGDVQPQLASSDVPAAVAELRQRFKWLRYLVPVLFFGFIAWEFKDVLLALIQ